MIRQGATAELSRSSAGDIVVNDESRGYVSYRVSGLPAGPFGETYVITTWILGSNDTHWIEVFVISTRHEPHLYRDTFEFVSRDVPEELLRVDEEYLLSEARQQAQNYLDDALYQLAERHGDHVLARYRAELVEVKNMPLLSLWMRSKLHEEIRTIAKETRSPRLKLCLNLVTQGSVMRRG
jgi:hypothetical protein